MKTIALLLALTTAGCACWTDQAKARTPGCIVAHDVVDCTSGTLKDSLPFFASIIGGLLAGGIDPNNIPWDHIAVQAEGMGIKDGGCLLAQLKDLIFSKPAASPALEENRKALDALLAGFKQKHFGNASMRFKVKDRDGRVALL